MHQGGLQRRVVWSWIRSFGANRLESVDKAGGYVDQSDQYRKRRLYDEENELYVFDIPTARRWSGDRARGEFVAPAFARDGIVESVTDFSSEEHHHRRDGGRHGVQLL